MQQRVSNILSVDAEASLEVTEIMLYSRQFSVHIRGRIIRFHCVYYILCVAMTTSGCIIIFVDLYFLCCSCAFV